MQLIPSQKESNATFRRVAFEKCAKIPNTVVRNAVLYPCDFSQSQERRDIETTVVVSFSLKISSASEVLISLSHCMNKEKQ